MVAPPSTTGGFSLPRCAACELARSLHPHGRRPDRRRRRPPLGRLPEAGEVDPRAGALRHPPARPAPDRSSPTSSGRRRRAASTTRLLYNVDSGRPSELHPPPRTRPEILAELPIEARPVPGIPGPDAPQVRRSGTTRRSGPGSTNWTIDSWTRQENVIAIASDRGSRPAFKQNFEELWSDRDVGRSGRVDPDPVDVDGVPVTAWFTPGHGEDLSQRIATAIGASRRRVRIASPVITSGPILATLAELADRGGRDIAGVVDGPQTETVFQPVARERTQRLEDPPARGDALASSPFSAKPSTPWTPELAVHDFMHAKVTVADDVVFLGLVQPLALGRAERRVRARDPRPRARRAAGAVRGRGPRALSGGADPRRASRDMTSSTSSASSA